MMTATGFDGIAKGSLDRLERKAVRLNQPQARRKAMMLVEFSLIERFRR
jgi:hypothetical protein